MSPSLALLLCTIFVLFSLWFERRQATPPSAVLWVPTIWILVAASKPLAVWLGSGGEDMEAGSSLDRIFLVVLLAMGLTILAVRRINLSEALRENKWLLLLIGYMLASIAWSDIPYISFKRWVREFLAVVMAFVVSSEIDPRQALESVFRRAIYILIPFSILLVKYFPHLGIQYGRWDGTQMWIGVALQKNGLGRLCLIAIFFLVWSIFRRMRDSAVTGIRYRPMVELLVLAMALFLLLGPQRAYSATAVVSLTAGLATYTYLMRGVRRQSVPSEDFLTTAILTGIGFGVMTVVFGGMTMSFLASTLGRDATLTGRTEIWESLLPAALERPFLGHGFGGFWTTEVRIDYDISEAHSGYLDTVLDIGGIGLLLVSAFLAASIRKARRVLSYDYAWGILWICFLTMAVVHNISETSINSLSSHLTAMVLFLSVSPAGHISQDPGSGVEDPAYRYT